MTMRLPSTTALLLNGAVALIAVASVAAMGRSMLVGDAAEPCRSRYPNAVQWSLQRDDGELLTASDLQARLSATDWGIIDRVTVVRADHSAGSALAVDLSGRRASIHAIPSEPVGAGFEWGPQSAGPVTAACASYAFKLDRQFAFGPGGRLPGLLGGSSGDSRAAPDAFSVRLAWDDRGQLDILSHLAAAGAPRVANERSGTELPRGRWVSVDQEVVLNTPGRADGIVRVWLDGKLHFESRKVAFRADAHATVRGVLAEVAYARPPAARTSESRVLVTPFEFRW
ncbi:MAG: polysaccharide lyase [Hyphomicrobiaceae bacterium]